MKEEKIVTGKTVEEAVANAVSQYGGGSASISYEIIEMPKKGFLGFGAAPAKIKVIIGNDSESDDFDSLKDIVNSSSKKQSSSAAKPSEKSTKPVEKTIEKISEKPSEKSTKPVEKITEKTESSAEKPEAKKTSAPARKSEKTSKPAKIDNKKTSETELSDDSSLSDISDIPVKSKDEGLKVSADEMKCAVSFLTELFSVMELKSSAVPENEIVEGSDDVGRVINVAGEDSGILIGDHGETLDALQYLVNLAVNRKSGTLSKREYVKVIVDIENYRAKREETLRALARRMAARALKYRRNVLLEPMNPYERRIIHSEIQGIDGVSTHSVGSDENRRVIITVEGQQAPQRESKPRNYSNRRSSHQFDKKRPAIQKVSSIEELDMIKNADLGLDNDDVSAIQNTENQSEITAESTVI